MDKLEAENSIQLVSAVGPDDAAPLDLAGQGHAGGAAGGGARGDVSPGWTSTPRTDRTIRDLDALREEIRLTQLRGYSTDDRENEPHGACVGAAIVGADGRPVGAISISGPHFRIHDRLPYFGERARAVAGAIARELGADAGVPTDGRGHATREVT